MELPGRLETIDYGMDIDNLLNDEMFEGPVSNEPDEMHVNFDFDDWLNNGENFMQSFNNVI